MIPYVVINLFFKNDEITFNFNHNSTVRVFRSKYNRIDVVPIEEYVAGVVAGEMPVSFEMEALKAQAVASRSYVMFQIKKNKNKDFDVVDTVINQVYLDINDQKEKWKEEYMINSNKIRMAVVDTASQYLEYNGDIVEAMFFSTSAGMTENSEDVFSNEVPYLRSVSSVWDEVSPVYTDSKNFSKVDFYKLLNLDYSDKLNITNINTTSTGRIINLIINDKFFTGKEVCVTLKLRSTYFSIVEYDDFVVVNTKGYGHGVGMSQYGALGMAKAGYKYDEILKHYYFGVEIKKF